MTQFELKSMQPPADPQWQGEIPRTLLVARDGTMTTMEGVADFAQLRAWLDTQRD